MLVPALMRQFLTLSRAVYGTARLLALPVLLLRLLMGNSAPACGQTLTPPRYSYSFAPGAPLTVQLPAPLPPGVVPDSALRVFGSLTGRRSGTWSGAATPTLTFRPGRAFRPGESVQVIVRPAGRAGSLPGWVGELTAAPAPARMQFAQPPLLFAAQGAQVVVAGEWNADDRLDVAAGTGFRVRWALNPGDARFAGGGAFAVTPPGSTDTLGRLALDTRAADFDGDGDLDLLLNGRTLLSNHAGTFVPGPVGPQLGYNSAAGDLDGDGDLDLAVGYALPGAGSVYFYLNLGNGAFQVVDSVRINTGVSNPNCLALGDVDLDGDLDLVSTSYYDTHVAIRFNDGTGRFRVPAAGQGGEVTVGPYPSGVVLADFDGDGDLDLAATHNSGANGEATAVRFNNGAGRFDLLPGAEVVLPVPFISPISLVAADFDGDGDPDLALGGCPANGSTADSCAVWVCANDGFGRFGTAQTLNSNPAASSLVAGDFDGNGTLDLSASLNVTGQVATWLNPPPGQPPTPVLAADSAACAGTSRLLRLRNIGGLDSVRWDFGDGTTLLTTDQETAPRVRHTWPLGGTYRVRVQWWAAPYHDTLSVRVVVFGVPPATLLLFRRDTLLCDRFGASVTLRTRPDLPAGIRLRWHPTGDTSRTLLVVTGGLYVLTARLGPCESRDSVRVIEVPCPPGGLALAPAAVCLGDELILPAPATPFDSVTWRLPDGQVRRGTPLRYRFAVAGVRRVQLRIWRWPLGPVDTGSVVVTVRPALPPGRLLATPLTPDTLLCDSVGAFVLLRVRTDLPPGTTLRWRPGADTTRTLRVAQPGLYELTAATGSCLRRQQVRVGVRACPPPPVPPLPPPPPPGPLTNILTPTDGNGLNDAFIVDEAGPWTLAVFNRWGREVYRSAEGGYQSDWDGRTLSAGTYYYYLRRPRDGKAYKGWVELVK